MSFFPYEPPMSEDDPDNELLSSALYNNADADQPIIPTPGFVTPSLMRLEGSMATFLDSLLADDLDVTQEHVRRQFTVWCYQQFEAACARQEHRTILTSAEHNLARLLRWLDVV